MDNQAAINASSSTLPSQKVSKSTKNTKNWQQSSVDYYLNFRYTNGSSLRSDRNKKIINYDLANGIVNESDVHKICDPLGTNSGTFSDTFMHHDIISPILHELLGEESIKPDNTLVYSEAPEDLNRKQKALKSKIISILEQQLQAEIDPSTIDPNNPPPQPEEVIKAEKYSPSDMIESKANKMLKVLKKRLNTKWWMNQGFKDALIAGEEIYWVGILNGEPSLRKCNPLNITVILDDSDVFVDEAIAVIEERMLTIPSIIDEYGDELSASDLTKLDTYSRGTFGSFNTAGGYDPSFTIVNGKVAMNGITPTSSYMGNNVNNYALRVARVEWMSMALQGFLSYTDVETGEFIEKMVDESFKPMFNDFKYFYPDAEIEWEWINEPWEGVKIASDIYIAIRPKPNARRRMDNPYVSQLGYIGFIYEATNSRSVSLVDRLKSYQYLKDIISYKLQLVFASDIGKVLLMDMAQIPRSEGIDVEQWMYYLKEMKIAFINSFEEGKQHNAGKSSNFNQFQSIDLSLTNSIQQYINYLGFIDEQVYAVSGVNRQRLGKIANDEAVGNAQENINKSETVTQYLFDAHQEVKRRLYTALIEVAKVAWKKGMVTQYVNDDLGLEILNLEEFEFENSEFSVFVSNLDKDKQVKAKLDQLAQVAMEQQKADLSTIMDTILNDSPKDIINILRKAEQDFYQRQQDQQKAEQDHQQQLAQAQQEHEQQLEAFTSTENALDRESSEYIADEKNRTDIQKTELIAFGMEKASPEDTSKAAELALKQQDINSKHQREVSKQSTDKEIKSKELSLKERELELKEHQAKQAKLIEDNRIKAEKSRDLTTKAVEASKLRQDDKRMQHEKKMEEIKGKNKLREIKAKPKPTKKK